MKKFNLRNLSFLVIMTVFGFVLLPIEIVLFALLLIYLPFEYLVFRTKYQKVFKKYRLLFFIRFNKTLSLYKIIISNNIKNLIYDSVYRCFITINKVYIIKNGLKFENTIRENLLKNIEDKYSIKIEEIYL